MQIHGMDSDEWFVKEGDLNAARALIAGAPNRELFLYRGDRHLFADNSLPSWDEGAAALLTERVMRFLNTIR